jgi:carbon-monoxide dehydrogenase small subunit
LRRAEAAAPSPAIAAAPAVAARFETFAAQASASAAAPAPARVEEAESTQGWTAFEESFVVLQPPSVVWAALADVPRVAGCLPGAEVSEYDGRTIKGRVGVKLGPMSAAFAGSAVVERDEAALSGAMRGAGGDRLSGSRTKGEASYSLRPEADGAHTRVDLLVRYNLVGPLAQFSRSNLVRDLGRRLVAEFARNLNAQIGQTGAAVPAAPIAPARLSLLQFLWAWMMDRIRGRKG